MARVTLSFDNGPDPDVTPGVVDVLARRGVAATFFVIGRKLRDARACAERAHAEGHWIGNHTWTHETPLGLLDDPAAPEREIGATQAEIDALAHPERWFRPFGGGGRLGPHLLSPVARDLLLAGGYGCVLWSSVPRDWEEHDGWPARALADCAAQDRTLVVLHDFVGPAMRHLDGFIGALRDAGHELVQDFPPDCVPIVRGRAVRDLAPFVSASR